MAINLETWNRVFNSPEALDAMRREYDRWDAMTPEERKREEAFVDAQWAETRKHIAWLDRCAAKAIDPNLV